MPNRSAIDLLLKTRWTVLVTSGVMDKMASPGRRMLLETGSAPAIMTLLNVDLSSCRTVGFDRTGRAVVVTIAPVLRLCRARVVV